MDLLNRIETNPEILCGKAIVKGTRISVQYVLKLLASGIDFDEILADYRNLEKDDILACLLFASKILDDQLVLPLTKDVA